MCARASALKQSGERRDPGGRGANGDRARVRGRVRARALCFVFVAHHESSAVGKCEEGTIAKGSIAGFRRLVHSIRIRNLKLKPIWIFRVQFCYERHEQGITR